MSTGRRGRQPTCSDAAVQTCLSVKALRGIALRQTTGFVESLLRRVGLDRTVPDFGTLCPRQKKLDVDRGRSATSRRVQQTPCKLKVASKPDALLAGVEDRITEGTPIAPPKTNDRLVAGPDAPFSVEKFGIIPF